MAHLSRSFRFRPSGWHQSVAAGAARRPVPEPLDLDMRGVLNGGFNTADAARAATAPRPDPDNRGVISHPTRQVAVATKRGDTLAYACIASSYRHQSFALPRMLVARLAIAAVRRRNHPPCPAGSRNRPRPQERRQPVRSAQLLGTSTSQPWQSDAIEERSTPTPSRRATPQDVEYEPISPPGHTRRNRLYHLAALRIRARAFACRVEQSGQQFHAARRASTCRIPVVVRPQRPARITLRLLGQWVAERAGTPVRVAALARRKRQPRRPPHQPPQPSRLPTSAPRLAASACQTPR